RLTIDWTQYGIPGESLFEVFRYASRALSDGDEALLALDSAPTGCAFADGSGGVPKLQGGGLLAALGKVPNAPADVLPLVSTGQPTELVVLDEFDFTVLDLAVGVPKSLTKPAAGGSSSWSEWLVGTPGKSLDPEDAPHGHFVVYHLSELLGGAPGGASVEWLGGSFARVGIGQVTVLLADIDFESLPSVIQVLNNELIEGSGATLNLSWNIIDCDIFTGFEQELALH